METPQTRRTGRGLKWALGISLALNLLVVGAIGGAMLRHSGYGPEKGPRGFASVYGYGAPYMRALPPEARKLVNEAVRAGLRELPSLSERQAHLKEMMVLLRADPFDPEAVSALFDVQRAAAITVQSAAQQHWLKVVGEMSPEERGVLADRLEKALKRGPGPGRINR
jgi:uncharacterized membrane protein